MKCRIFDIASIFHCLPKYGLEETCLWFIRPGNFSIHINKKNEPRHEISKNVVCANSKASDHPAHTHSLIRAFASGLKYSMSVNHLEFLS